MKITVGRSLPLWVAVVLCCTAVRPVGSCPYLQRKLSEKQQQQQTSNKGATTAAAAVTAEEEVSKAVRRRTQSTCGGSFCFGSLTSLPAYSLDWSTLVEIARPTERRDVGYMEDSRSRERQLGGFDLNNRASTQAAGYTYLGQLVSHDMNQDASSTLGVPIDPSTLPNVNNPALDLDTIYSIDGCSPNLIGDKFVVNDRDYERDSSGVAQICDPRNDEHRILSQLTVAWMTLHNKFVDDFGWTFEEARDATIREWQAVVLSDMLPNLLDPATLSAVAGGDRVLYVGDDYNDQNMPVEFSTAAYRLFHSRSRTNYRLNSNTRFRMFDVGNNEPNLLGGSPLDPSMEITWTRFFGTNGVERARKLDMLYVQPLFRLPFDEAGTPDGPETVVQCTGGDCPITVDEPEVDGVVKANLALLDMVRGQTHSLPGGIEYAEYVQILSPGLSVMSLTDMQNSAFGLPSELPAGTTDVPLLLYLAHESVRDHDGEVLGELGSRIVAEVIYGLVETASPSILAGTTFTSEITGSSTVTMRDVLDFIGWP